MKTDYILTPPSARGIEGRCLEHWTPDAPGAPSVRIAYGTWCPECIAAGRKQAKADAQMTRIGSHDDLWPCPEHY
jgi:hypothetical protein